MNNNDRCSHWFDRAILTLPFPSHPTFPYLNPQPLPYPTLPLLFHALPIMIDARIGLIERFVKARKAMQRDPETMVETH